LDVGEPRCDGTALAPESNKFCWRYAHLNGHASGGLAGVSQATPDETPWWTSSIEQPVEAVRAGVGDFFLAAEEVHEGMRFTRVPQFVGT